VKVRVRFLAHLRTLFGAKEKDVELAEPARIEDLLNLLCDTPERRGGIFKPDGSLNPQVIVMKDGTNILSLKGLGTPLVEDDSVAVLPFLIGG
jgi:molybdopterin converting factor small subunit